MLAAFKFMFQGLKSYSQGKKTKGESGQTRERNIRWNSPSQENMLTWPHLFLHLTWTRPLFARSCPIKSSEAAGA